MVEAADWDPEGHRLGIGGRYRLGPELGRGGHSVVHVSLDLRLTRRVAVKMLRPEWATDPTACEVFAEEQRALALMDHPHIVRVLDADLEPTTGPPWVVETLVDGHTLRRVIDDELDEGRLLDVARVVRWALTALDAIGHVHGRGLQHGDVSPRNIMVDAEDDVVLIDIGSGRLGEAVRTPATAAYASPERVTGRESAEAADIYSWGAVVFAAVTGRAAFEARSADAVAARQVGSLPPSMRSLRPDVPVELDRIVLATLAKDPGDRPNAASVRSVLRDLSPAALAAGLPMAATEPGPRRRIVEQTPPLVLAPMAPRPARAPEPARVAAPSGPMGSLAHKAAAADPAGGEVRRSGALVVTLLALTALTALGLAGRAAFVPDGAGAQPVPRVTATSMASGVVPRVGLVEVPAVLGLGRDAATRRLMAAGLVAGVTIERDSAAAAGVVLAADPASGRPLARGSSVALVVASGRTTVPEVVGSSLEEALATLSDAGLAVSWSRVPSRRDGVQRSTPMAGERVPHGSSVTLVVGARAAGQSIPPSPRPAASATSPSPSPSTTPSPTSASSSSPTPSSTATASP